MSIRTWFADQLRTDWASIPELSVVRVIATERALDTIAEPTALIRLKRMEREPKAPLSTRRVGLLLTLISPYIDLDRAGDQVEELIEAAMTYLGPRFPHDAAEVVGYADRLAADIPVTIIAAETAAPTEEN